MRLTTTIIFAVTSRLVALAIANPVPNREAGGIAVSLTRHSPLPNSNDSIDFDEITSHGILVREKILRGLDNYERNTGKMHPFAVKQRDSESGLGRRGASLSLTCYQSKLWMAEISIGTPAKTLKVAIDTGSADMWVLQTGCAGISPDRDLWDPYSSDSAKDEHEPFQLKYSDGSSVHGNRFTDTVTIAGFTADPQTLGSATSYTSLRTFEYPADGLLGLASSYVSNFGADPLVKSLVKQNKLTNPTLSFKLTSSGAEMYVGGVNSMLHNGDIVYAPVTQPGFWQVSMDDVRVRGNIIFKNVPVIFDTGASCIFGDWDRVAQLHQRFNGILQESDGFGVYRIPCNTVLSLSFTFGGKTFEIPPENLKMQQVGQSLHGCISSIVGQREPVAYWTIGNNFLQGVYTVLDYSNSQVGFANLA